MVGDDCSTDRTVEILEEYQAKYPEKIRIIRNKSNLGFVKNFENLLINSTGEYVAFADQDDIWKVDHLKVLIETIGDCDLSCGDSLLIDGNGKNLNICMSDVLKIDKYPNDKQALIRLTHENFVQGSTAMIKKSLISKCTPFPEGIKYHDYWIAFVAALNNGIAYNSCIVSLYRQHGNNFTNNYRASILREIYNAFTGKIKEHSRYQCDLLEIVSNYDNLYANNSVIQEAIRFNKSIINGNDKKYRRKYFKTHYSELFLTNKHYASRYMEYVLQ